MRLPWSCEACEHKWDDSPMFTYDECPSCYSEHIGHGELIQENWFENEEE